MLTHCLTGYGASQGRRMEQDTRNCSYLTVYYPHCTLYVIVISHPTRHHVHPLYCAHSLLAQPQPSVRRPKYGMHGRPSRKSLPVPGESLLIEPKRAQPDVWQVRLTSRGEQAVS